MPLVWRNTLHRFSLHVAEFIALGSVGQLMAYEKCFGQLMVSKTALVCQRAAFVV